MENGHDYQLPRFRKIIDTSLMAIGLLLFVVLGLRAARQVDDKAVVAGQKNHAGTVAAADYEIPFFDYAAGQHAIHDTYKILKAPASTVTVAQADKPSAPPATGRPARAKNAAVRQERHPMAVLHENVRAIRLD